LAYGFYKNGILLYLNDVIKIDKVFLILLYPLIGVLCAIVVNLIKYKRIKLDYLVLSGLLVGMMMPYNFNIFVYAFGIFGLLFGATFLEKFIRFNVPGVIKVCLVLFILFVSKYSYANVLEASNNYAYSFSDIIFGRQVGGVFSSSFLWTLIALIYLCTDYYYKKEIPIFSYLTYGLIIVVSMFFTKDLNWTINNLVASSPLFVFTFAAPISIYSSYTPKGKIIFGIIVGIITGVLTLLIGNLEAAIIAVAVTSFFKDIIDKIEGQNITN